MKSKKNGSPDSFDKESFTAAVESAVPQMIAELSDLFERRVPRIPKKAGRQLAEAVAGGIEASLPYTEKLEGMAGDISQIDTAYRTMEEMFRALMLSAEPKARLRPGEDVFGYTLRKYGRAIRPPYRLKRLKQFRLTHEGIWTLIKSVVNRHSGIDAAQQLIEEFERKHAKEYMRYANALDARPNIFRSTSARRMTHRDITRLMDLYRDGAAAFENRLRLLVGLNHIARGKARSYDELRKFGYNDLLHAVSLPDNPLLHFLQGSVDRNVRNALMHAGVSSSISKGVIRFADRKCEVEWTLSEFRRRTKNLILTFVGAAYLEHSFNYARTYYTLAAVRYLRINPPTVSPAGVAGADGGSN